MNKKLFSILLLVLFLFSSSCQKKQVVQTPVENPTKQALEDQTDHYLPPGSENESVEEEKKPPQKDIPFSSPDLNLRYKKYFIKTEDEIINGRGNYFFIPLQIRNNQFEYCIDQNLVRFDLKTKTEKVYKDVFRGLSITAPMVIPGDWIIVDKNRYYFTESVTEGDLETKFAICKDGESLKTIWRTKLFEKDPEYSQYINNKLMRNDRYLFVAFKENFRCYCIELETGRLVWTYDSFTTYPYLDNEYLGECESAKSWQTFYLTHVFSKGIVLDLISDVDVSKAPKKLNGESIEKRIVVSMDGKFINELESEVIIYLDDQYLYQDGCKSLIDNKNNWSGTVKFLKDEFMRFHKKNNVTINPYIYTSNNRMFYVQNNEVESKIIIFDNKSGKELWKKQLQNTLIFATIQYDERYYVFYKENNNGFLLIHDIKSSKEKTIPITLNKENPDFYMDYSTFKAGNQDHLIFSDSLLSFNEEKGVYQSLFLKKELDDYIKQRNFGDWKEPYYFSNQDFFVIAYNPIEYDRGISKGGGFIILEKK